ncbi:MAG: UDP-N-acetylmuramoyl-tripeptide--D-alanyl-D-alanine ligase [Clostridia bacterium]|nr:UDP-N-acetylmuramoyl-tripeptide--D-alanyl-D-alanine ligase [Clostridia bacterium]
MKIRLATGTMKLSFVADVCGGQLHGQDRAFASVCTDSREADGETLFVCLRGERTDGLLFVPQAAAAGCSCFLCERELSCPGTTYVTVGDCTKALLTLAGKVRETYGGLTVGVTGSVGKTTTKEMIAAVLSASGQVAKTESNFNSVIGTPLTLLSLSPSAPFRILEMGMSQAGEISSMSRAARPDIAVITNIGSSHLEMLGSRENIARAKLEICEGMSEKGTLICSGDEPLLENIEFGGRIVRVSIKNSHADVFARICGTEGEETVLSVRFLEKRLDDIRVRALGAPALWGAAYACAVGIVAGLDEEDIRKGLASYVSCGSRQRMQKLRGINVLEDAYNAAPESVRAALDILSGMPGKRAAVLADMYELGKDSEKMHRDTGAYAAIKADCLVCFGKLAKTYAEGAAEAGMDRNKIFCVEDLERPDLVTKILEDNLQAGDSLLVKGSHAAAAQRVIAPWQEN